jgi:hypothetical protein
MNSGTPRPMTIADAIILVAASAVGFWVGRYGLIAWLYVLIGGFDRQVWAADPFRLSCLWGLLISRHTQRVAAIFTLTVLALRILRPRPDIRRLVRRPGFTACLAASLAICVGGTLNIATNGWR